MDVLFLSIITGLVAMVIALAWIQFRRRRAKRFESSDEKIDLFEHETTDAADERR